MSSCRRVGIHTRIEPMFDIRRDALDRLEVSRCEVLVEDLDVERCFDESNQSHDRDRIEYPEFDEVFLVPYACVSSRFGELTRDVTRNSFDTFSFIHDSFALIRKINHHWCWEMRAASAWRSTFPLDVSGIFDTNSIDSGTM